MPDSPRKSDIRLQIHSNSAWELLSAANNRKHYYFQNNANRYGLPVEMSLELQTNNYESVPFLRWLIETNCLFRGMVHWNRIRGERWSRCRDTAAVATLTHRIRYRKSNNKYQANCHVILYMLNDMCPRLLLRYLQDILNLFTFYCHCGNGC